jgi:aspartyl-tRNA(Asn)/glutamyl-tRNA(Gln) amidotransferase subunit C
MGAIDDATVRHIAALARLEVDEASLPALRDELAAIVAHVAHLQEVDVSGVEPMAHAAAGGPTGVRADEVVPSLPVDDALAAAPDSFAGLFRVPRVLSG